MNVAELWAQIEAEQEWRQQEIRFFERIMSTLERDEDQNQFRRALVMLVYAHFEGFCKFAFLHYVAAINSESLKRKEANYALVAASMDEVFRELREPNKKCQEFKNELPDDTKLHRFARDREFIERCSDIDSSIVLVPDTVVDTESNLKPVVLRKILFRLGFQHDILHHIEGNIQQLLKDRNEIAHGALRDGIPEARYHRVREAAYTAMDEVRRHVMAALTNQAYLRP